MSRSDDVLAAVRKHFNISDWSDPRQEYAMLTEFSIVPGYTPRRADAYLIRLWGGGKKGHERIMIEVKISRSDFLREIKQPEKIKCIGDTAHRVYYATTEGVIKDKDDLGDYGHMLLQDDGTLKIVKRAKRNDHPLPISEGAFVQAFKRAAKSEDLANFAHTDQGAGEIVSLRRQNNSLYASLQREREKQLKFVNGRAYLLNSLSGIPCPCGGGVIYDNGKHEDRTSCHYLDELDVSSWWAYKLLRDARR